MRTVLHVLRSVEGPRRALLEEAIRKAGASHTLLLVQDAAGSLALPPGEAKTFVAAEDLRARGLSSPFPALEDDAVLDLIASSDTVIAW